MGLTAVVRLLTSEGGALEGLDKVVSWSLEAQLRFKFLSSRGVVLSLCNRQGVCFSTEQNYRYRSAFRFWLVRRSAMANEGSFAQIEEPHQTRLYLR